MIRNQNIIGLCFSFIMFISYGCSDNGGSTNLDSSVDDDASTNDAGTEDGNTADASSEDSSTTEDSGSDSSIACSDEYSTDQNIVAGNDHNCVLTHDETGISSVQCWGANYDGQLGSGTVDGVSATLIEVMVDSEHALTNVTHITAGDNHNCAIVNEADDTNIYCWGDNQYGQLGNGLTDDSGYAVKVIDDTGAALSGVMAIAAGTNHTCAIVNNEIGTSRVYCWGANFIGQIGVGEAAPSEPFLTASSPVIKEGNDDLTGITAIAAGSNHTCAIATDTSIYCWGDNQYEQLGNSTVSFMSEEAINITDGTDIVTGVTMIAAGGSHTCAVINDTSLDQVICWGNNSSYQLGEGGTMAPSSTPITVMRSESDPLDSIQAISAGGNHTCIIASDASVYCWGDNNDGQLGDDSTDDSAFAVNVLDIEGLVNLSNVEAITAGGNHTCAILNDGTSAPSIQCWGSNGSHELGESLLSFYYTPIEVGEWSAGYEADQPIAIATGFYFGCAIVVNELDESVVQCWGDNETGKLGNNSTTDSFEPVVVLDSTVGNEELINVASIAAGAHYACAVTNDGEVKCWGDNSSGQLGDNTEMARSTAVSVVADSAGSSFLSNVTSIAAGSYHTCAIVDDESVQCWGDNSSGQLGDGSTTQRSYSGTVKADSSNDLAGVKAIATGAYYTCAIVGDDGQVMCWGANPFGQLGDGSTTQRSYPVEVKIDASTALTDATAIAAGVGHACALIDNIDGTSIYCWGYNGDGQLGDGTGADSLYAVQVVVVENETSTPITAVTSITAGTFHSCAITEGGEFDSDIAWCWGQNSYGQLGNGTKTTGVGSPSAINVIASVSGALFSNVIVIDGGNDFTCSIVDEGDTSAVKCWGYNYYGQLGKPAGESSTLPIAVTNLISCAD